MPRAMVTQEMAFPVIVDLLPRTRIMTQKTVFYDTLIPDSSSLRRIPLALRALTRLQIDALVFSADAIDYNWNTLVRTAEEIGGSRSNVTGIRRAALLSAAWSIVDELDAVRQIVVAMLDGGQMGPVTQALLRACEPVKALRDKKRHLAQNLRNIEAKILAGKKGRSPLLGTLSWMYCENEYSREGIVFLVQAGMLYGGERIRLVDPDMRDFDPPVGLFQLDAFEICLDIRTPISAYADWIEGLSERWISQMREQIDELVNAGEDAATLEAIADGNFSISLPLKLSLTRRDIDDG